MSDFTAESRAAHPTNTSHGRDYKAWAKQIMYRERRGDNGLLAIQVSFARIALGIGEQGNEGNSDAA